MAKTYLTNKDILEVLTWRQATKKFDPHKHVSDEDFDTILEAARLSPSSFGLEQWNLLVIEDAALLQEIHDIAWGARGKLPEADRFVVITAKTSVALDAHGPYIAHMLQDIQRFDESMKAEYIDNWFEPWAKNDYGRFDAPQLLHEWAARQAYIAMANMMTIAALLGVDTCPIEGFNVIKMTELLERSAGLDPKQDLPVAMVAFGYRAEPARPKKRRPMNEIVRKI